MIGPDHRIRINKTFRLQWEEAQQCHVLLFPEGMVQLNGPASEILNRCPTANDQHRPVTSLITELTAAFPDTPATELAQDVYDFLTEAQAKGWIDVD